MHDVHVIGGGLAGSEAAWQIAEAGLHVRLSEMRGGGDTTPAHESDGLAEMVCSNSFRSDDDVANAVGLLHHEMRQMGSLVMRAAADARVPAGSALAVDRTAFSDGVTAALAAHPNVTIVRERIDRLPESGPVIVATGPLTAAALAADIAARTGEGALAFFDAIAPIVYRDSIDFGVAWYQSRWDKPSLGGPADGEAKDYINLPLDRDQYLAFHRGLLDAEKTEFKDWERDTPYFDGCMPVEVMAERGVDTLRFGPMKPVGLTDPRTGGRAYAVVQLRQDNALGTLWNMVGFQTKMKHAAQVALFRTIPGLQNAEFARLGGLHRNSFLKSPVVLDGKLRLRVAPHIRFAGQITGCEGYVESAAVGLAAARMTIAERAGRTLAPLPPTTALGALIGHITGGARADDFQPMNVNFGLFPELDQPVKKKADRKAAYTDRAKADLAAWLSA